MKHNKMHNNNKKTKYKLSLGRMNRILSASSKELMQFNFGIKLSRGRPQVLTTGANNCYW